VSRAPELSRRAALAGAAGLGGLALSGCDRLTNDPRVQSVLSVADLLNMKAQRLLLAGDRLAPEFSPKNIAPVFRANGTTMPQTDIYKRLLDTGFTDWRLRVDGLVQRPLSLSMADLKRLPARTQITRHDCVEGWSCIGQWTGVPLGLLLKAAGLLPQARYAVFHCADDLDGSLDGSGLYYESIDLIGAFHPQTILAYGLNGKPLDIAHGAPLRVRLERQLGYKMAKYIMRIEILDSFARLGRGKGGYWEDRGYEWYAGI
jgi:DMSO/TMAO reductase YedYZ molybdopterin-dependent catalytic subunit